MKKSAIENAIDKFYASYHILHELQQYAALWRQSLTLPYDITAGTGARDKSDNILNCYFFINVLDVINGIMNDIRSSIEKSIIRKHSRADGEYPGFADTPHVFRMVNAKVTDGILVQVKSKNRYYEPSGRSVVELREKVDEYLQKYSYAIAEISDLLEPMLLSDIRHRSVVMRRTWKKIRNLE